ncbi:2-phosphosulfolactate phosphatase [Halovenus halobia]|uniref:2-phosphosulfolactate phosphatase n=1 Tax=Halovenus halobia TaxID=3396622 RepID=UPI003F577281
MTDSSQGVTCNRVDRLEDIPEPVPTGEFVVVDVIISSTSIVRLLEEGASYVKPFGSVEAALEFKRETDDALLVGEDGGGPIEGFDLSPLPSVIADADIEGRPVGIRTSNGTRAMERIGHAEGLLVGSTVNAGAVAEVLRERNRDSLVVAAGRQGEVVTEDTVGAELITARYHGESIDESHLQKRLRESSTAEWLREIGYGHEVDALAAFDSSETVPTLEDGLFVSYTS